MSRRLLRLGPGGTLVRRLPDGSERRVAPAAVGPRGRAYLLLDASGSMAGESLQQAICGGIAFARDAVTAGYDVGLITFASDVEKRCPPDQRAERLEEVLRRVVAQGSTNMAAAIAKASASLGEGPVRRAIIVITDGLPDDVPAAIVAAEAAKARDIQIVTIGTANADAVFLSRIATSSALASVVPQQGLAEAIASAARLLPSGHKDVSIS